MAEPVTLVVDGERFSNWTQWEVASDLLTPSDAFSLSLGAHTSSSQRLVTPGALVEILLGNEPMLKGRIDEVKIRVAGNDRSLEVVGRDLAADLVDCHLPTWTLYDQTLKKLAEKALAEFGVETTVQASGAALEKIAVATTSQGETGWAFLDRYARKQAVLMYFAPSGALVLEAPDYETPTAFNLKMGSSGGNVVSSDIAWSIAERFSAVYVTGQEKAAFMGESTGIRAMREDPEMAHLKRVLRISDGGASTWSAADRRAQWELERRRAEGLKMHYVVKGFRQGGALWQPGQGVHITDTFVGLDEVAFLTGVHFSFSLQDGARTALTLRRKGALLGLPDAPKASSGGLF